MANKPWAVLCLLLIGSGGEVKSSSPVLMPITESLPADAELKLEKVQTVANAPLAMPTKENEVRKLFSEKRYEEALTLIADEIKKLNSGNGDAIYREWLERQKWILKTAQAWAFLEKQNCSGAMSILQEIPAENLPDVALKGIGYCKLMARDWQDAEGYLSRYIQGRNHDQEAVQLLARVKESQGLYEEALDLTKSLESMPDDGAPKLDLEPMKKSLQAKQDESSSQLMLESGFFKIHYQPNIPLEFIEKTVETMNRTAGKLNMDFGIDYPSAIIDVFFHSAERFGEITHGPEWVGGVYDGQIRLPISDDGRWNEGVERSIRHELAHALLAEMVARRSLPTWFQEGFAQMAECASLCLNFPYAATTQKFFPIEKFDESFMKMGSREAQVAYKQSLYLTIIMHRQLGNANVRQMFALIPGLESLTSKDIVEQSGMSFEEVYEAAKLSWEKQLSL